MSARVNYQPVEEDLGRLSHTTLQEFRQASLIVEESLADEELRFWLELGQGIAHASFRSWEAASEYFHASPRVLHLLGPERFFEWAQAGLELARTSLIVSAAYFKVSPEVLPYLPHEEVARWRGLGQRLYRGTSRSERLTRQYFQTSAQLVHVASLDEIERLVAILEALSEKSNDLTSEVLESAAHLLPHITGELRMEFLASMEAMARFNGEAAKACFMAGPSLLEQLPPDKGRDFLALAREVARTAQLGVADFFTECAAALALLDEDLRYPVLCLACKLAGTSFKAAAEFLVNCPLLLQRLTPEELKLWCDEGLALLEQDEEGGIFYFRLQSKSAMEALERVSPEVELRNIREVLRLYCKALMGRGIEVHSSEELSGRGIGWTSVEMSSTEGTAIYAPPRVRDFASKEENFEVYKVMATHQAGHLEFFTFEFGFEEDAAVFPSLRLLAEKALNRRGQAITDFERFFDLFNDRRLALDIFTVVEDARIDARLKHEYRGIRASYRRIQHHSVRERPPLSTMALREAILEALIQVSLDGNARLRVPSPTVPVFQRAVGILNHLATPEASVEDSTEATIRLYSLIRRVPNVLLSAYPPDAWVEADLSQIPYADEGDTKALVQQFLQSNADTPPPWATLAASRFDLRVYRGLQNVGFRGELKPELVQTLMKLRAQMSQDGHGGRRRPAISVEALQELLQKSVEFPSEWISGEDLAQSAELIIGNILREWEAAAEAKAGGGGLADSLVVNDAEVFTYDEWDFRARAYRPGWCKLTQRTLKEGSSEFYEETLAQHRGLVASIEKQFELLRPEAQAKVKRLQDGEEYDLDAVTEAIVEKKAGHTPSDKVYWRRNKNQRDVSVVLLLDMSLSTEEKIWHEGDLDSDGSKKAPKRIIDLEKESVVLLIRALERVGDAYGIYGFSGIGRDDVQFFTVKDIKEPFSERVVRRIDKVAPVQGTRMGPAIRHAITKLAEQESRTKLLILISDGRPQDRNYGTEPYQAELALGLTTGTTLNHFRPEALRDVEEREYAVHDTRMALLEARQQGVIPFFLSVDRAGHDYLRTMCGDIGYEVVSDIEALPRRLASLYKRLTT